MRETERLFYGDAALGFAKARVLEVLRGPGWADLVLDATLFYPEGGGQPWDLGTIGGLPLASVREEDGRILHRLPGDIPLRAGDEVELVLDSARRRHHCQQHSGQHLLSAVFERECGVHTLSFHLGAEASTVDVSLPRPEPGLLAQVEASAEGFIAAARPILVHLCPPEELGSFDLRKRPPVGEEELRVVEIGGYDWVACCGTHLSSCAELRVLKILSAERYKGNTRISFVAGDRAVALLGSRSETLKSAALLLGCSAEEVPDKIEALGRAASAAKAEAAGLARARAALEVEKALGKAGPLVFAYDDRGAEAGFETAKAGSAAGRAVVVLTRRDSTVAVLAPAGAGAAGARELGSTLKALLPAAGARGGGGANSFRASFQDPSAAEAFAAAAALLLAGA